tara:strand:+ start:6915 stop:7751 length:837 start_codon:yes stop_codon:yes gene_type:complete
LIEKILITGASGYIGSHIRKKHTKKFETYFLVNNKSIKGISKKNLVNKNNIFKKINYLTYVIHLAGIDDFYKNKKYINKKNKELNILIKKIINKYKPKKLIFTSTNRVYENVKKKLINEKTKIISNSNYAINKIKTENIIKKSNCDYIILRLPSVISKKFSKGLIFRLLENLKKNEDINIYNPNSLFNNVIHADELIKIIFFSIEKNNIKNLVINTCSIKPLKLIEVVKILKKKVSSKSKVNIKNTKQKSKYYSTKLQNKIFYNKISSTKKTLLKLFS